MQLCFANSIRTSEILMTWLACGGLAPTEKDREIKGKEKDKGKKKKT